MQCNVLRMRLGIELYEDRQDQQIPERRCWKLESEGDNLSITRC